MSLLLLLVLPFFFAPSPFAIASITCLKVNATATARWTNAAGQNCSWTGKVGSNFGIDAVNEGE